MESEKHNVSPRKFQGIPKIPKTLFLTIRNHSTGEDVIQRPQSLCINPLELGTIADKTTELIVNQHGPKGMSILAKGPLALRRRFPFPPFMKHHFSSVHVTPKKGLLGAFGNLNAGLRITDRSFVFFLFLTYNTVNLCDSDLLLNLFWTGQPVLMRQTRLLLRSQVIGSAAAGTDWRRVKSSLRLSW